MNDNVDATKTSACPKCGVQVRAGRAFCADCGAKVALVCKECMSVLPENDHYCSACGAKAVDGCQTCHATLKYRNQIFCTECGSAVNMQCADCGAQINPDWKFCGHCGRSLSDQRVNVRTANKVRDRAPNLQQQETIVLNRSQQLNKDGLEAFQADNIELAIDCFQEAVRLDPDNASYHSNLAVALDENGSDEEALEEYECALQLDPNDTTTLLSLGYMYNENGEHDKAVEAWTKVIKIAPNTAEAIEARDNLDHQGEI